MSNTGNEKVVEEGRDPKNGRFQPGNQFSRGRTAGVRNKKLNLSPQMEFIQGAIDYLPNLLEFLKNRVENEACLTSAKMLIERALPHADAAGAVINEKFEAMEAELERCEELLHEQQETIDEQNKILAMGKVA